MFSKGVILIFLILGLSSSIAHSVPHQNRAQNTNPCSETPAGGHHVLASSSSRQNANATNNGTGKSTTNNGTNTSAANSGSNTSTTNNGTKTSTDKSTTNNGVKKSTSDNGNTTTNGGTGTQSKLTGDNGNKNASSQDNGKNQNSNNNPQTSLTLDKSVINVGSESDGLKNATNGTSASLTSTNNFINFCKGKTITSGQQIKGGSCNPIPMGDIPNTNNIPTCKYVFPQNLDTLKANQAFTMKLAVANVELGTFTNAETNYYAAPQQLNAKGQIIGHTHLVIEQIDSLKSTTPTKPLAFAFFKGVNTPAGADGTISVPVPSGLPAGTYRCGTIGTQANHVPWSVAVAQHGIMEDVVYITVTADGNPSTGTTGNNNNNTASGNANSQTTTKNNGGKKTGNATGNSTATNANGGNTASGNNTTTKDNGGKNTTDNTTGNTTATNNKGGGTKSVALDVGKPKKAARNSPAASPSQSSSSNKFQLSYRKE
ncbi:hypothetical protein BGY98DRAFT_956889 [Russula aff. rugulosa BPL654]|nr:hypothetical protein BGY98DRAFT_956889 [Russula aff. rugulosa BPL654]